MTLTDFLLARIAEDEWWAREASRHGEEPLVADGEHWGWWCPEDEAVKPDPIAGEFMECSHEHWSMSLRSVEQYPYRSLPGVGPSIHLTTDSELPPVVGGHIARHDPARVLAECEAKRGIVDIHQIANADQGGGVGCMHCDWDREWGMPTTGGCDTLRYLALPYADHPDYREEWKP